MPVFSFPTMGTVDAVVTSVKTHPYIAGGTFLVVVIGGAYVLRSTLRQRAANINHRRTVSQINTILANAIGNAEDVKITPPDQIVDKAPESLGSEAPGGEHRDIADRMAEQRGIDAAREREGMQMPRKPTNLSWRVYNQLLTGENLERRVRAIREGRPDPDMAPGRPQRVTAYRGGGALDHGLEEMGRAAGGQGQIWEDEGSSGLGEEAEEVDTGVGGEDEENEEDEEDEGEEEAEAKAKTNEEADGGRAVSGSLSRREGEDRDGAKKIEDVQKMR